MKGAEMKHMFGTVGVAIALVAIVGVLFAVASILNDLLEWLMTVDVLCWAFFAAGIVVTAIASIIASVIGKRRSTKVARKETWLGEEKENEFQQYDTVELSDEEEKVEQCSTSNFIPTITLAQPTTPRRSSWGKKSN